MTEFKTAYTTRERSEFMSTLDTISTSMHIPEKFRNMEWRCGQYEDGLYFFEIEEGLAEDFVETVLGTDWDRRLATRRDKYDLVSQYGMFGNKLAKLLNREGPNRLTLTKQQLPEYISSELNLTTEIVGEYDAVTIKLNCTRKAVDDTAQKLLMKDHSKPYGIVQLIKHEGTEAKLEFITRIEL